MIISRSNISAAAVALVCVCGLGLPATYGEGELNASFPKESNELKEITFQSLYPQPIYAKSYFSWLVLGSSVAAAGAFSYFTAGAGAPAAATGVSTVASWIAGGGAGSYMAGLSTVGAAVGGNAMVGAAILNGVSLGLGGGMGVWTTASVGSKFLAVAALSVTMVDGVAPMLRQDSGKLHYTVRLVPPENIGSARVRIIVKELHELEDKRATAIKSGDKVSLMRYGANYRSLMTSAKEALSEGLTSNNLSKSDTLVLAILNYMGGEEGSAQLFQKAVANLSSVKADFKRSSYLNYLSAISALLDQNEERAVELLTLCSVDEPYAVEPVALKINLMAQQLQFNEANMLMSLSVLEKNFDSDRYKSGYSLLAPYYRIAVVYYRNEKYAEAEKYFKLALDQIGFIQGLSGGAGLKVEIKLGLAKCLYKIKEYKRASEVFESIAKGLPPKEREELKVRYED